MLEPTDKIFDQVKYFFIHYENCKKKLRKIITYVIQLNISSKHHTSLHSLVSLYFELIFDQTYPTVIFGLLLPVPGI